MEEIKKLEELFEANELEKALELVNQQLVNHPQDEQLNFWLGKIHYKKQEWGLSINAFTTVLEINPDNQEAKTNADLARAIIGYFTPDMFNP